MVAASATYERQLRCSATIFLKFFGALQHIRKTFIIPAFRPEPRKRIPHVATTSPGPPCSSCLRRNVKTGSPRGNGHKQAAIIRSLSQPGSVVPHVAATRPTARPGPTCWTSHPSECGLSCRHWYTEPSPGPNLRRSESLPFPHLSTFA